MICYEIIFPAEVADDADRPQWLINLTNDGWYGDSAGPRQHLVATRMRAVEEGLTIVRAANSGISALISKAGTVIKQLPLNVSGALDVYLPQSLSIDTWYKKYHNFSVIVSLPSLHRFRRCFKTESILKRLFYKRNIKGTFSPSIVYIKYYIKILTLTTKNCNMWIDFCGAI